ncbi:MAG TPA: Crp/Fnr family transcriptional regulator [Allosphingosinicella sp.]|nr:Crp/Fnr family transcriptional regulator [Allosphingosinicella sp.]
MPGNDPGMERALDKLRARDLLSPEEEEALRTSVTEIRELGAGKSVVRTGSVVQHSTLLLDGLCCRYKDLSDGQRQIMEVHVGGDFLDLHGFLLKQLDHSVATLTPVRFAMVPHERLRELTETHPHLARMLWFSTLLDAAIHRERILSIGRRDAMARIAHLLCEMYLRLEVVGLASDYRYRLPMTQADLADANGLTSVHVNRMLKKLRDEGLVTFRGSEVIIHDWEALQRRAEFDPVYLHLDKRPR